MSNLNIVKCIVSECAFVDASVGNQAWFEEGDTINYEIIENEYFLVDLECGERINISKTDFEECFAIV